jgi:hypothetical protein
MMRVASTVAAAFLVGAILFGCQPRATVAVPPSTYRQPEIIVSARLATPHSARQQPRGDQEEAAAPRLDEAIRALEEARGAVERRAYILDHRGAKDIP